MGDGGPAWISIVSLALLVLGFGGGLAKWIIEERRRKKKTVASLDGSIALSPPIALNGRTLFTLTTTCRNRGEYPVHTDVARSTVRVFDLAGFDQDQGNLQLWSRDKTPLLTTRLLGEDTESCHFEPGTESGLTTPLALPVNRTCMVEVTVALDENQHRREAQQNRQGGAAIAYQRCLVFST